MLVLPSGSTLVLPHGRMAVRWALNNLNASAGKEGDGKMGNEAVSPEEASRQAFHAKLENTR